MAYHKLIQKYENLGLQLVDLRTKDLALKASWPIKWKDRPSEQLSWLYVNFSIKDQRIWECNLDPKDIDKYVQNNIMSTSVHILRAWFLVNYQPVLEDHEEILDSIIWGNSHI